MLDQTAHNPVPTVYAAIELSKKSWIVAITQPAKDQPSVYRIKGGAFSDLVMRLRTATPGGERLLVCYEAGYDRFLAGTFIADGEDRLPGSRSGQSAGQSPGTSCED